MCQTIDSLPVRNENERLVLTVKRCDKNKATRADPANCALAWSAWRQEGLEMRVYRSRAFVKRRGYWGRLRTSSVGRIQTMIFDLTGDIAEGTYVFEPLSPRARPNGRRQGSNKTTVTGKKRPPARIIKIKGLRPHA